MKKFSQMTSSFGLFIFLISLLVMPLGGLSLVRLDNVDVLSVTDQVEIEEDEDEEEALEGTSSEDLRVVPLLD